MCAHARITLLHTVYSRSRISFPLIQTRTGHASDGCRGHTQRHRSAAALAGRGLCHLGACEKWLQFLKTPACPRSPSLPCRLAPARVGPHLQGVQRGCAGQHWNSGRWPLLGGANTTRPAVSRCPGAAFKTGPHPHRFLPPPRRWLWSSCQHLSPGSRQTFRLALTSTRVPISLFSK